MSGELLEADRFPVYNPPSMTPEELRTWREKHKLSQSELAEMLGVFWLTISKWENKVQKIPPYLHLALETLARRLKSKKVRS